MMFDRDNLNPNNLSFKKEDDKALYDGCEIYTHRGKVNQNCNLNMIKRDLSATEWDLHTEYNDSFLENNAGERVHIIFGDVTYNNITYNITLKAVYFGGLKKKTEEEHKKRCEDLYSRIRWKKVRRFLYR